MTEIFGVPLRSLRLCGGEFESPRGQPMTMERRAAFDPAAAAPHQPVHLHIGRVVVDEALLREFGGDKAALAMQLQADIAARLGAWSEAALSDQPTRPQAGPHADLVDSIGAAVASQLLPHLHVNGGL